MLATAAPDVYAVTLANLLGFNFVVASGFRGTRYVEAVREKKRDEVLQLVRSLNGEVHVFFTDHVDDISLAKIAGTVVLVNAAAGTLERFESAGVKVSQVDF